MMRFILTVAFVVAAMPSAWARATGFNPGTVVGNVLENPPPGCVYGFGIQCYEAPGSAHANFARSHHHHRKKAAASRY